MSLITSTAVVKTTRSYASKKLPRTDRRYGERPIRIGIGGTDRCVPHRCYKFPLRALDRTAAFVTNWAEPGTVLEVYHSRTGALFGSYRKHPDGSVTPFVDKEYVQRYRP